MTLYKLDSGDTVNLDNFDGIQVKGDEGDYHVEAYRIRGSSEEAIILKDGFEEVADANTYYNGILDALRNAGVLVW